MIPNNSCLTWLWRDVVFEPPGNMFSSQDSTGQTCVSWRQRQKWTNEVDCQPNLLNHLKPRFHPHLKLSLAPTAYFPHSYHLLPSALPNHLSPLPRITPLRTIKDDQTTSANITLTSFALSSIVSPLAYFAPYEVPLKGNNSTAVRYSRLARLCCPHPAGNEHSCEMLRNPWVPQEICKNLDFPEKKKEQHGSFTTFARIAMFQMVSTSTHGGNSAQKPYDFSCPVLGITAKLTLTGLCSVLGSKYGVQIFVILVLQELFSVVKII